MNPLTQVQTLSMLYTLSPCILPPQKLLPAKLQEQVIQFCLKVSLSLLRLVKEMCTSADDEKSDIIEVLTVPGLIAAVAIAFRSLPITVTIVYMCR